MILLNRVLSFLIPLIFLLAQLLYLKYSTMVYSLVFIIFLLLIFYNLSLRHWQFSSKNLLTAGLGIINQTIFLVAVTVFSLFVPANWFYWVLTIILTLVFYLQLTYTFQNQYQFLLKGYQWLKDWQFSYIFLLIYILQVLVYNFAIYFNWSTYWTSAVSAVVIIVILVLNSQFYKFTWLQLLFILYFGWQITLVLDFWPMDVYARSLVALVNYYFILNLIIYKKFLHYYYEAK